MLALFVVVPLVSCSRINAHSGSRFNAHSVKAVANAKGFDIPEATKDALLGFLHKKEYRYIIITIPDMKAQTATEEKNYEDFRQHLMSCPGVCIGAYDFSWMIPRGHGTVPASEPVLFTWAPDTPNPDLGLSMSKYMKLKMQMPFYKDSIKQCMDNFNGAFIQCNSEDELSPDWVVPKLRGGRMGSRIAKLNPEGKALYDQLTKEIAGGSDGVPSIPIPEEPKADVPQPKKPAKPAASSKPAAAKPPVGRPMSGSKEQIENFITQMVDRAFDEEKDQMIETAKAAAKAAVEQRPSDDIDTIAKAAAREAVQAVFKSTAEKLAGK